ncbi:MAG: hypothetical protein LBK92_04420 [Endomicrobium sp.]|jgi:hypothetical protein|nr:hypothetical protein [Endomicrobium sp.]
MNGIRKKFMCLTLALAFIGVSSQAKADGFQYWRYIAFREQLAERWNISTGDIRTIFKGLFMGSQDWQNFGMLGIEDNLEKVLEKFFNNETISLTSGINAGFGICRNFALGTERDTLRGICTIGETIFSDKIAFEKIVEGGAYSAKRFGFIYHNQLIGWSKILTLEQEDSSKRLFYPNGVTRQDCEEEAAKTFKLIESLMEISPLYFTNKPLF